MQAGGQLEKPYSVLGDLESKLVAVAPRFRAWAMGKAAREGRSWSECVHSQH